MTSDDFRRMALELEGAVESEHMSHPDFRVSKKIFATLNKDETVGMVKLTPDQQELFIDKFPAVFSPCAGAWGKAGSTFVALSEVGEDTLRVVLDLAWRNYAKK